MSTRVALVTGGTRGIGLGIATSLAGEGFDLVLCGRRSQKDVADAVGGLERLGRRVYYHRCDVSDSSERLAMLDAMRAHVDRIDVLVNNAGVPPLRRLDILEASEESFERVMRINLQGPYFLTQAVARWMVGLAQEQSDYRGCIVNISSVSSTVASPTRGEYCVSKAGVSMASRLWAVRLAEYGIRVYEVRPGLIRTDMTEPVREQYDEMIHQGFLLQDRWGKPEDVGKTVAALVRGDLPYSTGSVIMVDGGMTVPRL